MTPLEHLAIAEAALMTDQNAAAWIAIQSIRRAREQLEWARLAAERRARVVAAPS